MDTWVIMKNGDWSRVEDDKALTIWDSKKQEVYFVESGKFYDDHAMAVFHAPDLKTAEALYQALRRLVTV